MGGPGSGSWCWCDSKSTTGSQLMIDIRWMKKQGYLIAGARGMMSWTSRGKETGSIGFSCEKDRLILKYRNKHRDGEWDSIEDHIWFTWTPCNYGGRRQWFLCPSCNRRVTVVYGGKYFRCRHCHNLTYSSQQESQDDRLRRKARKIREKLGVSSNLAEPILFKPKHMHWTTFDRLRREAERASYLSLVIGARRLGMKI